MRLHVAFRDDCHVLRPFTQRRQSSCRLYPRACHRFWPRSLASSTIASMRVAPIAVSLFSAAARSADPTPCLLQPGRTASRYRWYRQPSQPAMIDPTSTPSCSARIKASGSRLSNASTAVPVSGGRPSFSAASCHSPRRPSTSVADAVRSEKCTWSSCHVVRSGPLSRGTTRLCRQRTRAPFAA